MSEKTVDIASRMLLAAVLLLSLFPFYWMISNSLKTTNEIYQNPLGFPAGVDFSNYFSAWAQADLAQALGNSLIVTTATVAIVISAGSLAAFSLARLPFVGRAAFLAAFVSGMMVAPEVVLVPLFNLFRQTGLMNTQLAVILTNATFSLPLAIFIFWQFFSELATELHEAARIDGCSDFQFFWRILLPLSAPVLASVAIFTSLSAWNEYLFALTFLRDNDIKTVPLRLQAFFGEFSTDWPSLFAALVMSVLPIILLYLSMQKTFIQGLTTGAIKG